MSWSCKTKLYGSLRTNTENFYLEFDILPVKKIFVHTVSKIMCKYIDGMLPELLLEMFTPISDILK